MSSSAGASGSGPFAGGSSSGERRASFWCHECQARTTARAESQDLCCFTCGSGFIEEMSDDRLDVDDDSFIDDDDDDDFDGSMMPLDPIIETLLSAALQPQRGGGGGSGAAGSRQTSGWTRRRRSRGQLGAGQPRVVMGDQFLQMLLSNLGGVHFGAEGRVGGFVPVLPLYGNPGDYAWGRGGLDAVVTNLLNQMEGAGPPPMQPDSIIQIPKIKITPDQVEAKLQCSVCWDDFSVGEEVRKLVCDHIFHDNCIVPWLQLHATCPVCRKPQQEPDDDEARGSSAQAASANDLFGPILGAAAAAAASSPSTSTAQSSTSAAAGRGPSTATAPEAAGSLGSTISTVLNHYFGLHIPSTSSSAASSSSSTTSASTASGPNTSTTSGDQTNRGSSSRPDRNDSFRDMDLE